MVNTNTFPCKVFLILFLFVVQACTTKVSTWVPSTIPANETKLQTVNTDGGLLADMVTLAMRNSDLSVFQGHALPVYFPDFPIDHQFGPFFYKWDKAMVVVGRELSQINGFRESPYVPMYSDVFFCQMIGQPYWNEVRIKEPVKVNREESETERKIRVEEGGIRIKLTPENLAASLSGFSTWEGVHLDTIKKELVLVGSSETTNPQISASDLVATYRAIFENEANGEAIFVDMDFKEGGEEYLVTFGGGLEDTRPGRVLYTSDLLLKALSSGVDPWIDEKPLVQSFCGPNRNTPFQKVYCNYISPLVHAHQYQIKKVFLDAIERLRNSLEDALLILEFARVADESSQQAWNIIFYANEYQQSKLKDEIKSKGYFTSGDARMGVRGFSSSGFDGYATLELVQEIFNLSQDQKDIIKEARRFPEDEDRILYAMLAFLSDEVHNFMREEDRYTVKALFEVVNRLTHNGIVEAADSGALGFYSLADEYLQSAIGILYLMSKDASFTNEFLKLNSSDQEMASFIILALMDKEYLTMLDNLQYTELLCNEMSEFSNDPFINFVCRHLSKYKRTYLGNLIKKEIGGAFEYKTVNEIKGTSRSNNDEGYQKIRYWFFPANEVLTLKSENDLNTFLFKKPQMEARSELLETRRGPYEAVNYENPLPSAVQENLNIINTYYGELSEIFPSLKELNNVVRMLAFFRWVKYYHSDKFDLSAFAERNDYGTPTPRTYPLLETVIALQDGSLLRSVGGVDLHSRTQVGFELEKMTAFEDEMVKASRENSFTFDGKAFTRGLPISTVVSTAEQIVRSYTADDKKVEIASQGSFYTVSHTSAGKLTWTVANDLDLYGDKRTIISHYHDDSAARSWRNDSLKSTVAWNVVLEGEEIVAQRREDNFATQAQIDALAITRGGLQEMYANHLPLEAIKAYLFACFQDVKLTHKNDALLVQFKAKGQTHHWMVSRASNTAEVTLVDVSTAIAEEFIASPVQVRKEVDGALGIALSSTVPSDKLIIDDLGFRNDSLLKVSTYTKELSEEHSIFDWRTLVEKGDLEAITDQPGNGKCIIFPVLHEAQKGQFQTHDLTNRAFLIEQVANLRGKADVHHRYVAYSSTEPSADKTNYKYAYQSVRSRHFVFDTTGFTPNIQQELLKLHSEYPSQVSILEAGFDLSISTMDDLEVIWITTLTEEQIKERIEQTAQKGALFDIARLRVFNVNNPVYDLGSNVFQYCPGLLAVGAWTRILNFMTVKELIVELLKTTEFKEIDEHTSVTVKAIQRDFRRTPTPIRLRIARELDEMSYTWEELRPISKRLRWIMAKN